MTWEEGAPTIGRLYSHKVIEALGAPRDPASTEYFGHWADIAASLQTVYEEIFFHTSSSPLASVKLAILLAASSAPAGADSAAATTSAAVRRRFRLSGTVEPCKR